MAKTDYGCAGKHVKRCLWICKPEMSANLQLILIATVGLTIIARSEGSLSQSEIAPTASQKTDALVADVLAKPRYYFNDYASLIDPKTAQQLNKRLEDFERQTSNQFLVVIYPNLPADTAIEDFALEAFRAWKPGQKGKNNGVILFIFVQDRKIRIQTGLGLEHELPNSLLQNNHFRRNRTPI